MNAVLAAGALVWRQSKRGVRVLLVERTQHRDWSLPKGKLDPGESLPECAVRELEEETGLAVTLGAPLGTSEYRLPNGHDKVVYYWQAETTKAAIAASAFTPNDEIHALEWLSLEEAKGRCTYTHDVRIIERFEARLAEGAARTIPIIAVRHAKAADPFAWDGPDASRELTAEGKRQASAIAAGLAAYGPTRVVTSDAVRCQQTVAPVAALLGVEPHRSKAISQDDYRAHAGTIDEKVAKAIRKARGTVLCSHAPVIPAIVTAVVHATDATETQAMHRASMLHTAEFTVMHVRVDAPMLVAAETHSAR